MRDGVIIRLLTGFIIVMAGLGCANRSNETAECLVTCELSPRGERTLMPQVDFESAVVMVEGTGPDNAEFSVVAEDGACLISELALGTWTITATLSEAEAVLASGSVQVELVAGSSNECAIALLPCAGTGTLVVDLSWSDPPLPRIESTLTPMDGEPETVVFLVNDYTATYTNEELATGYYLLTVTAYDGDIVLGGIAESICVLNGLTVSGIYDLPLAESLRPVSLGISLSIPDFTPLNADGFDMPPCAFRGEVIQISGPSPEWVTAVADSGQEVDYQWYANGIHVGSGRTIQADTTGLSAYNSIDLVTRSQGRYGSARSSLRVVDPIPVGGWSYFYSRIDGEEGIDGLSGARSVQTVPNSGALVTVGYDEDAVCLWRQEGAVLYQVRLLKGSDAGSLEGPADIAVSPDGGSFVVAAKKGNALGLFSMSVEESGAVTDVRHLSSVEDGIDYDALLEVEGIAFSPDGKFLYTAAGGSDAVSVFRYPEDIESDSLVRVQVYRASDLPVDQTIMDEPIRLKVLEDKVFVTAWAGDSVVIFNRDAVSGSIEYGQHFQDGTDSVESLNAPSGIGLGPDGESVYVASYYDNAVTHFSRNADGSYQCAGAYRDGVDGVDDLRYCRDVTVSPDGTSVAAAASGDDAVVLFGRDPDSGALTYSGWTGNETSGVVGLDGCRAVTFSISGDAFFAVASNDDALSSFAPFGD